MYKIILEVSIKLSIMGKYNMKIGFIGVGNMALAIINGLLKNSFNANDIYASDTNTELLTQRQDELTINITNNTELVSICDVVILAVKPNIIKSVCLQIAHNNKPLIISIAAGISVTSITKWLDNDSAIIRLMPNTPATIGYGATGAYANNKTTIKQKQQVDKIIKSIGIGLWLDDERLLDTITAISGSGPAYFFYMLETMTDTAVELGLTKSDAHKLATQTALGAAFMAQQASECKSLRQKVTSPNGTTYAAIKTLDSKNVDKGFKLAIKSAYLRSQELAQELAD